MSTQDKYVFAGIQMSCSSNTDENRQKALGRIEESAKNGAHIVCLQELFLTPYFCQREDPDYFDLAEPIPGPSTREIGKLAKAHKITVIASLFERRAAGVYHNTVVIIGENGEIAGKYRKMHIPDDPGYYEKYYFTPGDLGFKAVDTPCGKVGPLICWDQWYPEAARLTALQGAHILCYPTAIGWHPREKSMYGSEQLSAWRTIQRSHAIANGVYAAAVNRVGHEMPSGDGDGIEFWGSSFICDPFGVIIAEAPCDKETILYAEIDVMRVENVRRHWPFLRDRRTDAYQGISERILDNSI
ncbi:MAG: carbon-nitrogen hydrolase [Candidatus Omnitrophica bacterium]|nr:carbon-nitrogen hydrolase [Candidatus Omnitrophota bacterium]